MPPTLQSYRVRVPGLEDVFHVYPESSYSPTERRTRAQNRKDLIDASPVPWIGQAAQDIIIRLVDLEDITATLAAGTRIATAFIPELAPIARVAASLADVTIVADYLENIGLTGGGNKRHVYNAAKNTPGWYRQRLTRTLQTGKISPTIGELFHALEASNTILGAGLTLGGVMGLPLSLVSLGITGGTLEIPSSALLELATLAPAFFAANPIIQAAALGAGFALSALGTEKLPVLNIPIPSLWPVNKEETDNTARPTSFVPTITMLENAENALELTAPLGDLGQGLSTEDHFMVTMTQYMALATLAPFALATQAGLLIPEKAPLPIRARTTTATDQEYTPTFRLTPTTSRAALPIQGNPQEIRADDLPNRLLSRGTPDPLAWTREDPYNPLSLAAASLAGQAAATLTLMIEGPGSITPPEFPPEIHAAARRVEFAPPRTTTRA